MDGAPNLFAPLHARAFHPSQYRPRALLHAQGHAGCSGVLAFWLAVMAMLYEQRQRDRMVLRPHR